MFINFLFIFLVIAVYLLFTIFFMFWILFIIFIFDFKEISELSDSEFIYEYPESAILLFKSKFYLLPYLKNGFAYELFDLLFAEFVV